MINKIIVRKTRKSEEVVGWDSRKFRTKNWDCPSKRDGWRVCITNNRVGYTRKMYND